MSQKQRTASVGGVETGESPKASLSNLAELARQAYERRDTTQCLDLTRAMLLIDPDNADAQWMRSSVQSEMHRDLENARELLRHAHSKENTETESLPSNASAEARLPPAPSVDGRNVPVMPLTLSAAPILSSSTEKPGK